jgi:TRAP-type C4-dicarboxylate transport system permease small subunit
MDEKARPPEGGELRQSGLVRFAVSIEVVLKPVYTWLGYAGATALAILIVAMMYSIVGRRFFNSPLPASTELTKFALVIMTFTVIAIEHMGFEKMTVDIVIRRFPRRLQEIIAPVVYTLVIGIFGVLCWQLIVLGMTYQQYHQTLRNIKVEIYPFTYLAGFGIFTMIPIYVVRFLKALDKVLKR